MKSTKSSLGWLALLPAIIAFVLTGCPDPIGGGDGGANPSSGANPFTGTWSGTVTLSGQSAPGRISVSASGWNISVPTAGMNESGAYTYSGNSATLKDETGTTIGTATISENSLTVSITAGDYAGGYGSFTKNNDGSDGLTASDTATVTVIPPFPTDGTLAERLAWISSYATNDSDYTIEIRASETIAPTNLSYSGKTVKITLAGATTERTVGLSRNGSLFTIGSGVTLTLDDKVTLQGLSDNTVSLVRVNGGTLAMKGTAKITGNTASSDYPCGGGVYINGGSFTMNDSASVSGNTAYFTFSYYIPYSSYGGGVYVNGGSFTMNDNASVSGNTTDGRNVFESYGGGVYVNGGSFTMNDSAMVSGNTAYGFANSSGGGVVVSSSGSFAMSGNVSVSSNTAKSSGGGVEVIGGSFAMSGNAAVSGNTAGNSGGGVVVAGGSFVMSGGKVSGNTASSVSGGGVYVRESMSGGSGGSFTMSGGEVSGNTAGGRGGGVSVTSGDWGGSFTKTGGVIYGSNETDPTKRNVVKTGAGMERTDQGAAVYADSTHRRENTVIAVQNISKSDSTYIGQWND